MTNDEKTYPSGESAARIAELIREHQLRLILSNQAEPEVVTASIVASFLELMLCYPKTGIAVLNELRAGAPVERRAEEAQSLHRKLVNETLVLVPPQLFEKQAGLVDLIGWWDFSGISLEDWRSGGPTAGTSAQ